MPDCLEPFLGLLGYHHGAIAAVSNNALRVRYCCNPIAKRFLPWNLGDCTTACNYITSRFDGARAVDRVYHPLLEGVNDTPREVRRRLTGKTTPGHMRVEEASPPPKRRKWLFLPGPSRGNQENGLFPRIGMGSPPGPWNRFREAQA